MPSFLTGIMEGGASAALSFAFAAGFAVLVAVVRRSHAAPWIVGVSMTLLVAAVAWRSQDFDLVGWHGFMHGTPMLQLVDGAPIPPEDPAFAGGTFRYPWVEHWMMATLSRATGIHPNYLTIAFEIALFPLLLAGGASLASSVTRDREVVALAVFVTGFGISIVHGGPLRQPLLDAFPSQVLETRIIPIDKFANVSAMPPGYVAMAASAAATVAHVGGRLALARAAAVTAASTLVAALFHPLSWTGILAFQGVALLVLVVRGGASADRWRSVRWLALAIVVPSILALPYLRAIGASESSDGWTGLTSDPALLLAKVWELGVLFTPFALLVVAFRRALAARLAAGNLSLEILLAAIIVLAGAFLAVRFPGRNEYKFLLYMMPAASVVAALCLRELFGRRVLAGAIAVFFVAWPGAHALAIRPTWRAAEAVRAEGSYFRAVNPAPDELFRWIVENTPRNAVFLAADLRIPPLARRSLYIAVDAPWRGPDGWGLTRNQLVQWHIRRPDAVMYRRQQLATFVLDADWSRESPASVVAAIRRDVPGRPLFVHVRRPDVAAKLEATGAFELQFRNAAGSIYAVTAAEDAP